MTSSPHASHVTTEYYCNLAGPVRQSETNQSVEPDAAVDAGSDGMNAAETLSWFQGAPINWLVLPLWALVAAGITGNVLVCASILIERRLQNVTNYFLVSLAVADLLVSLFVMPCCIVQEIMGYWPFGLIMCDIWQLSDVVLCTSSIMHMSTISMDRYSAIRDPLGSHTGAKSTLAVSAKIATVWLVSFAIGSPLIALGTTSPSQILSDDLQCAIFNSYYRVYGSLAAFFGPLVVMLAAFSLTIRLLNRQSQRLNRASTADGGGMRRCRASATTFSGWKRTPTTGSTSMMSEGVRASRSPSSRCENIGENAQRPKVLNCDNAGKSSNGALPHRQSPAIEQQQPGNKKNAVRHRKHLSETEEITNSTCNRGAAAKTDDKRVTNRSRRLSDVTALFSDDVIPTAASPTRLGARASSDAARQAAGGKNDSNANGLTASRSDATLVATRFRSDNAADSGLSKQYAEQHVCESTTTDTVFKTNCAATVDDDVIINSVNRRSMSIGLPYRAIVLESTSATPTPSLTPGNIKAEGDNTDGLRVSASSSTRQTVTAEDDNSVKSRDVVTSLAAKCRTAAIVDVESSSRATSTSPIKFKSLVKKHGAAFKVAGILVATREDRNTKVFNSVKTERKAVKVLGIMFVIFCTCWAPFFSANLITGVCQACGVGDILFKVFLWFGYVSSTLNPIIYTTFNRDFKSTFLRLLRCRCGAAAAGADGRVSQLQLLVRQNPHLVNGGAMLAIRALRPRGVATGYTNAV